MIKSVRFLNSDPYGDMRESALRTMGLKPKSHDPYNRDWFIGSIISRHSHIRCAFIRIDFETEKSIRDQILRSKHGYVEPYVCSARPDRTGKPRDVNAPSSWYHDFNLEGLVKMCADRLCTSTEINTREEIISLKRFMTNHHDNMIRDTGNLLAPKCSWYGDCNEPKRRNCFGMVGNSSEIYERIGEYNDR